MCSDDETIDYVISGEIIVTFEPPLKVKKFDRGNEIGAIARYAYEREIPGVSIEEYEIAVGRLLVEALSTGIDVVIYEAFKNVVGSGHVVNILERVSLQIGEEDLES